MNKVNLLIVFVRTCILLLQRSAITDDLLDGPVFFDPSLYNPEQYLVSAKYPNPTPPI
jgi:carboxylesterase